MMKKIVLVVALFSQIASATKKPGCSAINSKKLNASLFNALCELPLPPQNTGLDRAISLFFTRGPRPADLWNVNDQDWAQFAAEHKKAEVMGLNPGHLADLLHKLEKEALPKEKSLFSGLIVRLSTCSDGEIAEQLASSLSRTASENPVLFLKSVSAEQNQFEANSDGPCQKKIQASYLAPSLTSAVLTTLMGQWEESQAPASIVETVSREKDLKNDPRLKPLVAYILGDSK
jgi:hypothetical protein